MKRLRTKRARRAEAGIVLLIAIFVLMLVSIVAMALIVSSGTESALTANYRSSATAYYAAVAGLEEARGRLQVGNPDYFNVAVPGFLPPPGNPLALSSVRYIRNPAVGETVVPNDPTNPYFDSEYATEFPLTPITSVPDVRVIDSVFVANAAIMPGPLYKWVRINAVTEKSLKLDVDNNGILDPTNTPLYYDTGHIDSHGMPRKALIVAASPPPSAVQALEVTALAVLPSGSQKIVQYVVAGTSLSLHFPAAMTLVGNGVDFVPDSPSSFAIDGNDQFSVGSCVVGAPPVYGVGFTNNADLPSLTAAINMAPGNSNYRGLGSPTSNLVNVIGPPPPTLQLDPNLQTAAGLLGVMQAIQSMADLTIPGGSNQTSLPATMSPSSPKIIYVNGDLDMRGWSGPGYGILAVSGRLRYDGHVRWNGIILVIGQGRMSAETGGSGEIDGALLVAQINGGSPPTLGGANVDFSQGSNGVFYSNCWIQAVLPNTTNKVLSFREVPQ